MRVVITGHRGQLGQALQRALAHEELHGLDLPEADITDADSIREAVEELQPQVVVHAAALTDVDGSERNPELAFRVNALGTFNVALACERTGAAMVHISTNDVFDGRLGRPYHESDVPSPLSVYARSKAAAEYNVRSLLRRFYIVRTSWLYARGGRNFVTRIVEAADRLGALKVVTDEVSTPTYAPDLAEAIARLIHIDQFGVYHLTNAGWCSRYDWARRVLELSGRGQLRVESITSDQWPRAAPPPLYTPLANTAAAALGIRLRPWEEALQEYFAG
jgi:dTDP-4-dehydrorhamnose reductase